MISVCQRGEHRCGNHSRTESGFGIAVHHAGRDGVDRPSGPRVAGHVSVDMKNLGNEPVIVMDVSSDWHKSMVEEFARLKAPLILRVENAPIETIKKMVVMRLGVGFVPLMCVREEGARGELSVLALDGFHQERSLYMVRRRAVQSHLALAFAKVAVAFGEDLKSGKQTVIQRNSPIPAAQTSKPKKLALLKRHA